MEKTLIFVYRDKSSKTYYQDSMEFLAVTNLFDVLLFDERSNIDKSNLEKIMLMVNNFKIESIEFSEFRRYTFTMVEQGGHLACAMEIEFYNPTLGEIVSNLSNHENLPYILDNILEIVPDNIKKSSTINFMASFSNDTTKTNL